MGNSTARKTKNAIRKRALEAGTSNNPLNDRDLACIDPNNFIDSYNIIFKAKREIYSNGDDLTILAKLRSSGEDEVVLKMCARTTERQKARFAKEVTLLQTLRHPHIIELMSAYVDRDYYIVVTEYCRHGTLQSMIPAIHSAGERAVAVTLRQIFLAVRYMHRRNVVHRDLKPANILVRRNDPMNPQVALIDFGEARFVGSDAEEKTFYEDYVGTREYMAPECIEKRFDLKPVDVWAVGVIGYELLTNTLPFHGDNARMFFRNIALAKLGLPDYLQISEPCRKLFKKGLMKRHPLDRATAEQVLNHEWLRSVGTDNHDRFAYEILTHEGDYDHSTALKQLIIGMSLTSMGREFSDEISLIFDEIDLDFDGFISEDDVKNFLKKIKRKSYKKIAHRFAQKSRTKDTLIDKRTFFTIGMTYYVSKREHAQQIFEEISSSSGHIGVKQLSKVLSKATKIKYISNDMLRKVIAQSNPSHEKGLTFDDFFSSLQRIDVAFETTNFTVDDFESYKEIKLALANYLLKNKLASPHVIAVSPQLIGAPKSSHDGLNDPDRRVTIRSWVNGTTPSQIDFFNSGIPPDIGDIEQIDDEDEDEIAAPDHLAMEGEVPGLERTWSALVLKEADLRESGEYELDTIQLEGDSERTELLDNSARLAVERHNGPSSSNVVGNAPENEEKPKGWACSLGQYTLIDTSRCFSSEQR